MAAGRRSADERWWPSAPGGKHARPQPGERRQLGCGVSGLARDALPAGAFDLRLGPGRVAWDFDHMGHCEKNIQVSPPCTDCRSLNVHINYPKMGQRGDGAAAAARC
eukprot:14074388-Alexandrium_andersonii.AAC.1